MFEALQGWELDSMYHHFNERVETNSANKSREWVDTAVRKLAVVKSNAIVGLMNSSEPHEVVLNTLQQALEVGSTISAHILASPRASSAGVATSSPVCLKMTTPLPGTVGRAPEMFADLISTLLGRSSVWSDSEELRSRLYSCVYSGTPIPPAAEWSASADGSSVSVTTVAGLQLKCSLLCPPITSSERENRLSQRMVCRNVTAAYTQQPMCFTVVCDGVSEMLSAHVYPCSTNSSGLLLGSVHVSGFEKPFQSCAVVSHKTLRVHSHWGVHEADAIALTTPYARGHMHTLANIYTKSCIMRAVLGDNQIEFETSQLGDMDEMELLHQYETLRDTLSSTQRQLCSEVWNDMCTQNGDSSRVRCVSGTLDCFKKDALHTDMALHTRNVLATSFKYNGVDHHVSSPLVLSVYGTYYHR
jgi:hypothetical protein